MSTPGGYGGGWNQDPNQHQRFDPLTGRPLPPEENPQSGETAVYPGGSPGYSGGTAVFPTGGQPLSNPDTGGYQGFGQYPQDQNQYPQTGGYQFPTGGFPQAPPPKPKRTGLIVGVIAAVLVVALGATLAIILLNRNSDEQAGGGGNPTSKPTTTTTTSGPTTTTSTTTTTTSPSGSPQYPGWQTVPVPDKHAAYDVPSDWQVEPSATGSVTIPESEATMDAVSTYKIGACPGSAGSFRAKVGFAPESTSTPSAAAKTVAKTWADALASAYKGKTAAPQTSTQRVNQGQTEATLAVVKITTQKDSCNPPAMIVAVVSFQSGSATESLVLFGDQDVSGAITSDVVAKVLTTARPAQ
jgi:hypothetical protein